MPTDTDRMQTEWDKRAEADALHFIETEYDTSDIDNFFEIGEQKTTETIDPILEDWDRYPLKDGTALDIGCGVGRMTQALADRFDHVIGIDVSEKMIERARSFSDDDGNIEFYSNDGESYMNVESEAVDLAYSYEAFQHFPNKNVIQSNLQEIARTLKPTGRANIHFRPVWDRGERYVKLFNVIPFPKVLVQYVPKSIKYAYHYIDRSEAGNVPSRESDLEIFRYVDRYGDYTVGVLESL